MPFLELFDETLDINSTENYELYIQAAPEGFSFCLLDSIRNKFILIRSFAAEENKYFKAEKISELIQNDDFLKKKYRKIKCVMPSPKFTLIPAPLYDPGKKTELFSFNHMLEDGNIIMSDKITDPDAFLLYSLQGSITDVINEFYPKVPVHHHLKILLDHACFPRRSSGGNIICIHVERDYFNMIVYGNNVLKFCNSFAYRNISDILYFIMSTFKNLDIKQEETVYLSGLTERYDDLSSGLSLYVRNIRYSEPSGNFTFSYIFNETELHRYINLFTLANCE